MRAYHLAIAAGLACLSIPAHAQQTRPVSFSRDVLPIFQARCVGCHGVDQKGGLKLDSYENLMQGGNSGPVLLPGNQVRSKIVDLISTRKMPPQGAPLTPTQIFTIRNWIQQGARDDSDPLKTSRAEQPLSIEVPKDGAEVKEKVAIRVPRKSIPPEGFVAIYIDDKFRAALAPESEEELIEAKKPLDGPVVYEWDTQRPLSEDTNLLLQDRIVLDGPHTIQVRTYSREGLEVERASVQVNVKNQIDAASNRPVNLWYSGRVGDQYLLKHEVDLTIDVPEAGPRSAGAAPAATGGAGSMAHQETTRLLVSVEDMVPATGVGFWRERRENPILVVVNNQKQVVRADSSSRYFGMDRRGVATISKAMEREKREPVVNPIELPGRAQRMNQPFSTNLRINLGAYIPVTLHVDRQQARIEGMEYQFGEPCAKIVVQYLAGGDTLTVNTLGIEDARFEIQSGTSTFWFSERTQRVVRAKHEITGTMLVPAQQGGAGFGGLASGTAGGDAAPGAMGGGPFGGGANPYAAMMGAAGTRAAPGGAGPYGPGGSPFGGGANPYAAMGPGGGPAGIGTPGRSGGGAFGSPYGAGPGSVGGIGAPGRSGGMSGMGSSMGAMMGMPGGFGGGGFGGGGFGGGTGITGPTMQRVHVTLKVQTSLADDDK